MVRKFNKEKALEVILYLAQKAPIPDIYHICKVIYFADRYHLEEYGRQICNDTYYAMKHGPVPSNIYQMLKDARDKEDSAISTTEILTVEGKPSHKVTVARSSNLNSLSLSDIEALDQAIANYGKMSFDELQNLSHDKAWESADINDVISLEAIAETLPSNIDLIQHLKELY